MITKKRLKLVGSGKAAFSGDFSGGERFPP